jgi:predicted metallopeptidase
MKEPITYWRAQEVKAIAESLIPEFHKHLDEDAPDIIYVFRSKHAEAHGRVRLACVRKISGLNAYLAFRDQLESIDEGERPPAPVAHAFFVMEVAWDTWEKLSGPQRIALVDHELSHIGRDGDTVGHDVEEFSAVLRRHGAWKPDLREFLSASEQQPLFEGAALPRKPSSSDARIH